MKPEYRTFPTRIRTKEVAADDDRDELGVIGDRAVEEAIEQLRQDADRSEGHSEIGSLISSNGNGPKSVESVREEYRKWAYNSLRGTRVEVAEFEVE
jgi:hypothetical protein